ncbi:hypothetical protein EDB86DRAFT_2910153 [Lactarius hatsudake]|nr:hypothetical protein EDB86DRAFT_2910153 [Lactarius hatsudake]
MVRTQLKPTFEEKKDSQKKKSSSKKAETGIWPCKINGCNKEFAREADLKRHQRTTKLHSQPGFACPQCEATFTRTDALRRHQKSRHNGVIIDPGPPVQSEENTGESSRSRGGTPKPKNKVHPPPAVAPGSGALPGYYRQQGINAEFVVFVPPRTQGVIVDPNYAVGHPTSAARLAQPSWGPPPWGDGTQPVPPYPIPGAPPPGYFTPYYHPGVPPLPLTNAQCHSNAMGQPYAPSSSSPDGTCVPSDGEPEVPCSPKPPQEREDKAGSHAPAESSAPVIDPSLDAPESHANGKSPISLAITSAAMRAVLVESRRIAGHQSESSVNTLGSKEPSSHTYVSESAPAKVMKCADSNIPPAPSATEHPSSTMLTEDGETMLHPAELLTQESLASPSPAEDP